MLEFYFCNFTVSLKLCPNQKLKDTDRTLNSNILFSPKYNNPSKDLWAQNLLLHLFHWCIFWMPYQHVFFFLSRGNEDLSKITVCFGEFVGGSCFSHSIFFLPFVILFAKHSTVACFMNNKMHTGFTFSFYGREGAKGKDHVL